MMSTSRLISISQELIQLLNALAEESFFDKINRPDSKWKVVDINNITFYVNHIKNAPLGAPVDLLDYIKNNHGLRNVSAGDNLCFFPLFGCAPKCRPSLVQLTHNLPKIYFVRTVTDRPNVLLAFNFSIFCT